MDNERTFSGRSWRLPVAILIGLTVLAGLLFLDLSNRGLVWRFVFSQTGEESIVGQVRGMVELGGNLIRQPLDTRPHEPIDNTHHIPYGINVFLEQEVERPKIEAMLQMIQEAGIVWLRQEFPWEEIEVDGRGQFTDSRIDRDGDGEPDTIDAWAKFDQIVELVEAYDLQLMVRLSNPPSWSRSDPEIGELAPPDDLQDFVNYAVAVAERYRGRISHYQIWNEPNIFPEWGNQFVDPARYTEMLCRTYDALKAIDPNITVITGAIAPTISLDGYFGFSDLTFLQIMYDNGAGECFDVLSAQGYGLFSGPTDRRLRATTVNVARHTFYRDLMVANGDAHKPIWLSEAAWNSVPDDPAIQDQLRYGQVTQDQAARYMPLMYQRAQEEWSWVGNVFYWFFTRKDPFESNQSFYYFRMVEPDYSEDKPSFTPLPVYNSVKEAITTEIPTLYRGTHQAEHWAISHAEDAELLSVESAQFDDAMRTDSVALRVYGTDMTLRWQSDLEVTLEIGDATHILTPFDDWQTAYFQLSQTADVHEFRLSSEHAFYFDSVTVVDDTIRHLLPTVLAVGAMGLLVVAVLIQALWRRLNG